MKLLTSCLGAFLQLFFVASVKTQFEHLSVLLVISVVAEKKSMMVSNVNFIVIFPFLIEYMSIITHGAIGPGDMAEKS